MGKFNFLVHFTVYVRKVNYLFSSLSSRLVLLILLLALVFCIVFNVLQIHLNYFNVKDELRELTESSLY